jgi:DNA-binding response OmpR family regulator
MMDKHMSDQKWILVIEDETDLADLLGYNLRKAGYRAEVAADGNIGLKRATEERPDLVVLDVMMPQLSGLQVARLLRTNPKTASIPILMLTAKGEEADQVAGLQVGADDYVTKPFSMKVLLARVEALLRRNRAAGGTEDARDSLTLGTVRVDLSNHEAWVGKQSVKLTLTEFRLLVALMRKPGKAIRRADLMYSAMGPGVLVTARTIDVHMAAIRKKLGDAGPMIRTIRGVGYLMSADITGGVEEDIESEAGAQVE